MDGMAMIAEGGAKQHLIDPEICIRCNTCEATCPIEAITHNDDNYVVEASVCNGCMACVPPCPTGAVDNWFKVNAPFSLDEQYSWEELPPKPEVAEPAAAVADAEDDEAAALIASAHSGAGGKARAPATAAIPRVNLFNRAGPALARVTGNIRVTKSGTSSDVHHVILDFGALTFPVLEGQSIGIVPPGTRADGKPHTMRLYSVSSPREGEKTGANNVALTVKRVAEPRPDGTTFMGVASNHVCDLGVGDTVEVLGPFGATFLMPDDPDADIVMICTGTGSAPFRAFTERRRRAASHGTGRLHLYFGARTPEELPYFGPLQKVPSTILDQQLCYSRVPGAAKEYVQDRMRANANTLAAILPRPTTHIYVCGLKGLETGVEEAMTHIASTASLDWPTLRGQMRESGRFHVETY